MPASAILIMRMMMMMTMVVASQPLIYAHHEHRSKFGEVGGKVRGGGRGLWTEGGEEIGGGG